MSVDWYASKNAWMTGEIHHQIRPSGSRVFPHQVPHATPKCHFNYAATRPGYHSLSKEEVQEETG